VYCELREPFIFNLYEPSPNESNTAVGGHLISEINAIMPQIFKQMHEDNLNDVVCSAAAAAAAAAAVCVCVYVCESMSSHARLCHRTSYLQAVAIYTEVMNAFYWVLVYGGRVYTPEVIGIHFRLIPCREPHVALRSLVSERARDRR